MIELTGRLLRVLVAGKRERVQRYFPYEAPALMRFEANSLVDARMQRVFTWRRI